MLGSKLGGRPAGSQRCRLARRLLRRLSRRLGRRLAGSQRRWLIKRLGSELG